MLTALPLYYRAAPLVLVAVGTGSGVMKQMAGEMQNLKRDFLKMTRIIADGLGSNWYLPLRARVTGVNPRCFDRASVAF